MKKVKVFIASSAELDKDKSQLDLFFSEKNKIYEKREILFVQKTWKDFESSLHKHFLQDRYDAYIRECDIVLFLFHTRLGQYTLRELEVANEVFKKSRKGKPRIFIFYKEGEQTLDLANFKAFAEKNYGHFCDTYTDYPELLIKVEKQLQILENNGYISPDYFNPQKSLKYVLFYILLPLLLLTSTFGALHYYSDMNMTLCIVENETASIPSLPFSKGTLEVSYGEGEKQSFPLDTEHTEVTVKGIHSKYRSKDAHVRFTAPGYIPIDTLLPIEPHIEIHIHRNDDLKTIFGSVTDEAGIPLEGVAITVQDITVQSDKAGNFRLDIPRDKQAEEQLLTAFKKGYQRWTFTAPVMPKIPWNIVLKK